MTSLQKVKRSMVNGELASDETIATVLTKLAKPDEYVAAVFAKLRRVQREQKHNAVVRIGITGTGLIPNYLIEVDGEHGVRIEAFDGQTHRQFTDVAIGSENWSQRYMTYAEMEGLLGQMRGLKRG